MALTATDLFNDATTREVGGIGPDQVGLIVSDLEGVRQMLSAAVPQVNNLSDLHAQIIINQLNEEIASVETANSPAGTLTLGTNLGQFVGRSINDIHRDIIDIAQGDEGVQALFNPTPLPALNTPPAPFSDNPDQTAFITQWIQDSNHLGQAATTIANNGFNDDDVAALVQQIQTYATNSNAFDQAQGGLWSARFWNEFRSDGTSGTAAAALINGLQTQNVGEINAAVEQLAANSGDVGSNNRMADGGSYADVVAAAQATAVAPTAAAVADTATPPVMAADDDASPATPPVVAADDDAQPAAPVVGHHHHNAPATPPVVAADDDDAQPAAPVVGHHHHNAPATSPVVAADDDAQPAAPVAGHHHHNAPATPPVVAADDDAQPAAPVIGHHHHDAAATPPVVTPDAPLAPPAVTNAGNAAPATSPVVGADAPAALADAAPAAIPAAAAAAPAAGLTATDLFNDATTREIGGIGPDQVNLIVSDLVGVQQMLTAAVPQINNLSDLHTQIIINQLNEEIASVENVNSPTGTLVLGTDLGQFVGRAINDIHRDIIDIAQGDAGVQALFNPTPLPDLITPAAPFHDSADQTAFVTKWIQDSNHLGQMATTIENNGFQGDIAGLVQQIQTYASSSNAFDQAQGGLWSARFWNEFRSDGTSGTAAAALVDGLQNHNAGEVNAAVEQLAANSADVGSNNRMADGGSYADVVAAAQATAVAPVGDAGGAGAGAGNGGAGGAGAGNGEAGGAGAGAGDGQPAQALMAGDLYFANMFNDATRILEGGLWHNDVEVGNQGHGTDGRYVKDLQLVQTGLTADVAAGDFTGDQLTHVNTVLADITTALAAVPGAVNNDAGAEAALRTAHLDIINTIENDPVLQALSIKDNNPGFNFAPPELGTPLNANTPHATFAELGAIFDDAQSKSLGGINANNLPSIQADLQTVHDGLMTLMNDHPQLFGGATGIHASTIVDQINLQLTNFNNQYGFNPDAAKATNDNFLDITDIVAGDDNLANMAFANGVHHGWTGAPDTDVVPVPFQDNAAQTNFWADFIASGNTLGAQAEQLVGTGDANAIQAFVQTLQGWESNIKNFDAAQGGVFQARFDNELLGPDSTVGADVAAMIKGLQTHDAALVTAAAEGFHDNAGDVSSNNVPLNGGTYNADGQTVLEALSTATGALPPAPVTPLTPASPAAATVVAANAPGNDAGAAGGAGGAGTAGGTGSSDADHGAAGVDNQAFGHQHHQHFEHMWC